MSAHDYELLDSGDGRKLERFGAVTLARPAASAVWKPTLPASTWERADAWFDRVVGNAWTINRTLPPAWDITLEGIRFRLSTTAFGHLGIFPEQRASWKWIADTIRAEAPRRKNPPNVLNLFAYSGGATLAAALAGASVCHLDASKGMVTRARENGGLNGLDKAPIRWIVEDVGKFLDRESRRGTRYDGIILDPPSFGRGKSGEVYKIEDDINRTLGQCVRLLTDRPLFVLLSCHTPAFTPVVMENLLRQHLAPFNARIEAGEMLLTGRPDVMPLPSGTFARARMGQPQ